MTNEKILKNAVSAALAASLIAAPAAFADTPNVNVYGVADVTLDFIKISGGVSSDDIGMFNRVSANSSILGFKGTEDIGGGMSFLWQFEGAVGMDASSGPVFVRDSYAGLKGGGGTLMFGNLSGPSRVLGAMLDVAAGATGISNNNAVLGKLPVFPLQGSTGTDSGITFSTACGRSSICASLTDNRWKNALQYVSPSLGGVTLTALYAANENKSADGAAEADTKVFDVGARYSAGPVMGAVTVNQGDLGNAAGTEFTVTRIGGSYNFGPATVRVLLEKAEGETSTTEAEQMAWGIGATFNVTPETKLIGQYYMADNAEVSGAEVDETGGAHLAFGVEHSLSKRTLVKAVYASVANDDAARYDFTVNAAGLTSLPGGGFGSKVSGIQIGVRHTF